MLTEQDLKLIDERLSAEDLAQLKRGPCCKYTWMKFKGRKRKMTNLEIYDAACGITRDASGIAAEITPVDHWWNEGLNPMPIYRIGSALYCCEGWNGETYKAFRVLDRFTVDEDHPKPVELRPIYRFQDEDRDFAEDDETSGEIVGFDVAF